MIKNRFNDLTNVFIISLCFANDMRRTGVSDLPLHGGKAPKWLFDRMVKLSESIIDIMADEYSTNEIIMRVSDPFWFQSLTCILGYDWHSSGTTTVVCGALKEAIKPKKHGFTCTGGKGKISRRAPDEIEEVAIDFHLSSEKTNEMKYASKMTAKIDNVTIQDEYQLYHHCFFFTETGSWSVIQQGMNENTKYARRYQWCSLRNNGFFNDPHVGIFGDRSHHDILNMTSVESMQAQALCVDLVNDHPRHLRSDWECLRRDKTQTSLDRWCCSSKKGESIQCLSMPRCLNWKKMNEIYDHQPKDYEEFISLPGVGASTVRALALISDLIYGEKPSWRDPVRYSYAHGGKDGVPFPVDLKCFDRSIQILRQGVEEATVGKKDKIKALRKLKDFFQVYT